MKLELQNGKLYEDPDASTIDQALRTLREDDSFAILSRSEMTYVQVARSTDAGFILEYQDGSLDKHYRAVNEAISLDDVVAAFQAYAAGGEEWERQFEWKKEDL